MNVTKGFTDFHSHILPQMDDGAKSPDMSREMLLLQHSHGVERCFLTPHYFSNREPIEEFLNRRHEAYERLLTVYDGDNMPALYLGAEVHLNKNLSYHDLSPLCLNGSNTILLEFPMYDLAPWMIEEIEQIVYSQQLNIMVAHIDRVMKAFSREHLNELLSLDDFVFQINNEAMYDYFSRRYMASVFDGSLKCVFGTDSHNMTMRRPNFDKLSRYTVNKKYNVIMATAENTTRLLAEELSL